MVSAIPFFWYTLLCMLHHFRDYFLDLVVSSVILPRSFAFQVPERVVEVVHTSGVTCTISGVVNADFYGLTSVPERLKASASQPEQPLRVQMRFRLSSCVPEVCIVGFQRFLACI